MCSDVRPGEVRLRQFVEEEADTLLNSIRLYVLQTQLATGPAAATVASELLDDVVIEALKSADRFDPSRQPMAWLLGIALNLIRRRIYVEARRNRREPLLRDLSAHFDATLSDEDLFGPLVGPLMEREDDVNEQLEALLALIPPSDQRLLRLALRHDLSGEQIAAELGITPGAARVRLHRAIQKLRAAHETPIGGRRA